MGGRKEQKDSYQVLRQVKSISVPMGRKTSYPKALSKYLGSPRAFGIQKFVKGIPAGLLQPTIPLKIKVKGQLYERGYVGQHNRAYAESLASGFRKEGHKAVVRKFKSGWQVFVKFNERSLL